MRGNEHNHVTPRATEWVTRLLPVLPAIVLLAGTAVLGLSRLDNTLFWDDEALVGINARNLLTTGKLTAWDGRNLYAFRNGSLLDANLRTRDTEMHFWLTALSFKLFGVSTWAGRFPSVMLGLGALVLLGVVLRGQHQLPWPWVNYALGSLGLSVVFLLGIRQCRYYALVLFLALLVWALYQRCLVRRRAQDFLALAAGATLLFYAHLLTGTVFLLALGITHLCCYRGAVRGRNLVKLLLAVAVFAVATMPYAVLNRIWDRPEHAAGVPAGLAEPIWFIRWLTLLWWNLRDLSSYGGFPWLLALGGAGLLILKRDHPEVSRVVWPWVVTVGGFLVVLAGLSPQPTRQTTVADVRYLMPLLPFLAGVTGWMLWKLHQKSRLAAMGLFLVALNCNILSLAPGNTRWRWLLPAYIWEINHAYPTSYRAAADFLQANARQDDLVLAHPDFCNYPLMFYQGDKVIFCCLLNRQTALPHARVEELKAPLFMEENFPLWFIAFGAQGEAARLLNHFSRPHLAEGRTNQYRYTLVTNLNVYWFDTSRPELPWHSFGPRTDFDHATESVYVFRRTPAQ